MPFQGTSQAARQFRSISVSGLPDIGSDSGGGPWIPIHEDGRSVLSAVSTECRGVQPCGISVGFSSSGDRVAYQRAIHAGSIPGSPCYSLETEYGISTESWRSSVTVEPFRFGPLVFVGNPQHWISSVENIAILDRKLFAVQGVPYCPIFLHQTRGQFLVLFSVQTLNGIVDHKALSNN